MGHELVLQEFRHLKDCSCVLKIVRNVHEMSSCVHKLMSRFVRSFPNVVMEIHKVGCSRVCELKLCHDFFEYTLRALLLQGLHTNRIQRCSEGGRSCIKMV